MTLLPKKSHPNYGIYRSGKKFLVQWTQDGKPKRRTLDASGYEQARKQRDHLYEKLIREQGAMYRGSPEYAMKGDRHIYEVDPYVVIINGKRIGTAKTLKEAREMRNAELENI